VTVTPYNTLCMLPSSGICEPTFRKKLSLPSVKCRRENIKSYIIKYYFLEYSTYNILSAARLGEYFSRQYVTLVKFSLNKSVLYNLILKEDDLEEDGPIGLGTRKKWMIVKKNNR
jgi:hypothetical protein